jgi:hypothetical protein
VESDEAPAAAGTGWQPGEDHPTFDTGVAHASRVYDYWLGGKDNYAADRKAGDVVREIFPGVVATVRANRAFLARAVRYLAGEVGIRQFLDIGTGIPTANNTHEVAQSVAPDARVVYVDNDPVVLAHARALLTSEPGGVTDYLDADLRDTHAILARAARTLDFSQPVAVMILGTMHLIADEDDPYGVVTSLVDATVPGSYLAVTHVASDIFPEVSAVATQQVNPLMHEKQHHRSHAEVERFFGGLNLVEPGLVKLPEWRPDGGPGTGDSSTIMMWGGVGRKP